MYSETQVKMSFDVGVAKDVGSDCAIILSNIEFWQEKNRLNNRHFYEDRFWTYNSVRAWLEFFPWMTERRMRTCMEKLEKKQYLITGVFNKKGYDRTKWYTSTRLSNEPLPKIEKKPKVKKEIELPEWLDADTWNRWEKHRTEKGKTLTPSTRAAQIKKIEKNWKENHIEIINQSITEGWLGFFEIKTDKKKSIYSNEFSSRETDARIIAQKQKEHEEEQKKLESAAKLNPRLAEILEEKKSLIKRATCEN